MYSIFQAAPYQRRYKKNLKFAYVVHPTFWCKVVTWFLGTFTVSEVKHKIKHVDGVRFLYNTIRADQIEIPQFVIDHDRQVNGLDYHSQLATENGDASGL
jgi:hypothetical protein